MCAALIACGNELAFGDKSARDVFKSQQVVELLGAAVRGDTSEAKRLTETGVDVNAVGEGGITPLLWTLAKHDLRAVKILLDVGADPDKYVPARIGERSLGFPAIWAAASSCQKEALQLMLDHGGDPNLVFGNDSVFMMAISNSCLDCGELLLQHGADINYHGQGVSALDMAMLQARFGNAVWLLKHGYTYDLPMARRALARKEPPFGEKAMKAEALEIVDRLLAEEKEKVR